MKGQCFNLTKFKDFLESNFEGYEWSVPPKIELGLLTTNVAFKLAKEKKSNPKEIASEIKTEIEAWLIKENLSDYFEVKIVGPYVNLDLKLDGLQEFFIQNLNQIVGEENILKTSDKKLLLEYLSPNVAKPLHAGHIRNANLGESLRRILKLKYPKLITDNHWGDWGVQFGILLWGWKIFLEKGQLETEVNGNLETVKVEDYEENPILTLVKVYIWANGQKDSVEGWDALVREEFIKLEKGDIENKKLWQEFVDVSKESLKSDQELLNVPPFDLEQGESFYEQDMKDLSDFMEKNDLWEKEGNARYIDLESLVDKWPEMPSELKQKISNFGRCYMISSNGYTTYVFRDIATRWQWAREHQADKVITITGNEQKHNFDQAFSVISYLASTDAFKKENSKEVIDRLSWQNLGHIGYGFLTLPEGKMSTRKGNILTARDLIFSIIDHTKKVLEEKGFVGGNLDEKSKKIAISALKWYDLARDSSGDIVLDIPKILSFEGNTGIYQLYTVARLTSILNKNYEEFSQNISCLKIPPGPPYEGGRKEQTILNTPSGMSQRLWGVGWQAKPDGVVLSHLNQDEIEILKETFVLSEVLESITENYKPHNLCNHIYSVSSKINSWYGKYSVSGETDEERKQTLLIFCDYLRKHLWFSLELLGIEPVESL